MRRLRVVNVSRILVLVAAPVLAVPGWSAKATSQPAATRAQAQKWMPRLLGLFRVEGSAELRGEAGTSQNLSIQGQADCRSVSSSLRLGLTPGIECLLDMTSVPSAADGTAAQDSAPTRHTAVLMYAIDQSTFGVWHMMVDDEGVAEGGTGLLADSTLDSTSRCARIKGTCLRKVRITAGPNPEPVRMEIEMEVDGKKVGGQQLTFHRGPTTP